LFFRIKGTLSIIKNEIFSTNILKISMKVVAWSMEHGAELERGPGSEGVKE